MSLTVGAFYKTVCGLKAVCREAFSGDLGEGSTYILQLCDNVKHKESWNSGSYGDGCFAVTLKDGRYSYNTEPGKPLSIIGPWHKKNKER